VFVHGAAAPHYPYRGRLSAGLPIGVFDSGLGGLTVVRALRDQLPNESILYLGDTARIPYGTRSPSTVVRYARGCARVLTERGIKLLVVACNTASAVALEVLQQELDVPVIGVVGPGARAAVEASLRLDATLGRPGKVGVLGTLSTVASGAYPRAVRALSSRVEVCAQAAPLLVPLVEEGWLEGSVPELAAERYLRALAEQDARVLVLGCTHYRLLKSTIQAVALRLLGANVVVVDGAEATACDVQELLLARSLGAPKGPGSLRLLVTDLPESFQTSATRFLGHSVDQAELVDIAPE
jgi:glutamate racemase